MLRFGHREEARSVTDPGVGSGALLAVCFFKATPQEIGMPTFMDNSENVERVAVDLVIDEIRKWPALAAWKPMRSDVISALALEHDPDRLLYSFVEIVTKSLRDLRIARFSVQ